MHAYQYNTRVHVFCEIAQGGDQKYFGHKRKVNTVLLQIHIQYSLYKTPHAKKIE